MQRRDINAPDAPAPVSAYTQAVEVTGATRTLYISGQVGIGPDGKVPDDIVAQSRLAWANLTAQLRAAGMTLDHVVKVVTILPDAADLETFGALVIRLLHDPDQRRAMGHRARERVRRDFLGDRHLIQWVELLTRLGG